MARYVISAETFIPRNFLLFDNHSDPHPCFKEKHHNYY